MRYLSGLLGIVDPLLHPLRRRRAIRRLRGSIGPGPVLFICYGNICRSPFAAAVFRREFAGKLAEMFGAKSAGFTGADRSPPPDAIVSATRFGVDISTHRSSLITVESVRGTSLVAVMSADQGRQIRARFGAGTPPILVLGDLDPHPVKTRTIRDPWNCPPEVFDETYRRIDRCIRVLAGLLNEPNI